ncbi:autotransporter outer membrane beta-barrel domain-containing protein [Chitinophaga japonensis]|uniref:Uncharacterized protein n=1 Tax=Chitinophaga japonensis TaxID=104662 RepID=A0A562SJI0_CHIJA|nr:hypothetical protein [Chitinophaga japonensis]TWI80986.1 hypothetical protein LX66_5592 [Chitinophaga japonensis]
MNKCLRIAAKLLLAGCLALCSVTLKAQLKVGNNPTNIQRSAVLELESDRQGLLLPRLTDTVAINAITPAPPDGMIIYLSLAPNNGLYVRRGGHWERLANAAAAASNWGLTGNDGTNPTNNFIGTSDNAALSIRANNMEAIHVTTAGNVELKQVNTGAATDLEVLVLGAGGSVMRRTMSAAAFTNAISEVNGLTAATQTFATGTAGNDFNITSAGSTHTFNVPVQDGTKTNGLLTQADWDRINNAQKEIVIGTFDITPVATGLSLDNTGAQGSLVLHAADATNPGAVSTGAQTFGGAKTFQDDLVAGNNLAVTNNLNVSGAATLDGTFTITNALTDAATAENDVLIRTATGEVLKKTLNPAAFEGAIQHLGGQTGPDISLETGTTGTDVNWDSTTTANVITLNIPDAAVGARGAVTTGEQAFAGAKEYRDSVMVGGVAKPNSTLQVEGSLAMAITTVNTDYAMTVADNTVLVNPAAPVTITLPAAAGIRGRIYTIKKIGGGLDNAVTIVPAAGQIEGGASYPIYNDWTFVTLQTDGTNWYIIKK